MALAECLRMAKTMLFTSMLTVGVCAYIMVIWAIIKHRKLTFNRPFYHICLSLAVNDILGIFYLVIDTIMQPNYGDSYLWTRLMGFATNVIWYGLELHQLLIAINRSIGVFSPAKEITTFTPQRVNIMLFCIWILGIGTNLIMLTTPFSYVYYGRDMKFYNFSYPEAVKLNVIRELGIQPAIFALIFIVYVVSGWNVRISRKHAQISHRESHQVNLQMRLLLQGIFVTIPQFLAVFFYHILYYFPTFVASVQSSFVFLTLFFSYLAYTINPCIYMAFNSELRLKIADCIAGNEQVRKKLSHLASSENASSKKMELIESACL